MIDLRLTRHYLMCPINDGKPRRKRPLLTLVFSERPDRIVALRQLHTALWRSGRNARYPAKLQIATKLDTNPAPAGFLLL